MDKKYAFMYRRISSLNQLNNNSLPAQKQAIQKFANEKNIKIVGDYVDSAKTGTSIIHRSGYQKMISDLDKHPEVKYILAHNLDRLHRNAREQLNMIYELRAKNIGILTPNGLNTLDEECMSEILDEAATAEKYSRRLSKETMKGLKVNAEQMLHNGGIPPYGYVVGADKRLHIDDAKAPAVERIFEMYAAGMSYDKIIQWLDKNGYKTAKGKSFGKTSIKSILENEKYCGNYFWNKRSGKDFRGMRNSHKLKDDYFHVIGAIPNIVSEERFNKVQDRLRDNKKIRNHNGKNFYPMNGKLFCEKCGSPLKGKIQYSRTNKNNEPVKQYRFTCDCSKIKTVNEKYLDDMVIYGLRECIFSPANCDVLLEKLNEYAESQNEAIDLQISIWDAKKAEIEKRHKNLLDVVARGDGIKSVITEIDNMDKQIEEIEDKICVYKSTKKTFTQDDLCFIKSLFPDYVREQCNEDTLTFLDDAIDRIKVGDTIDVKLKKNIKIDRDTKKIFME
jgi:site-specific DNA recombinase